ncbi:hypothetical protein SAMN06296386_103326 [Lachnospiraceae bacterium]|nr:hypothetical protein SAMN06296386_103326 [Lachnospiraceae bacterium]
MAVNNKNRRRARAYGRSVGSIYLDGNTVRTIQPGLDEEDAPVRRRSRRKNKKAAEEGNAALYKVSPGYYLFVVAAIFITAAVCIWYVDIRSKITASQRQVSRLESQLNELKLSNDEEYERIMGSVDLEEIKRVAMNELGMKYPDQNQVVNISGAGDDYVRQFGKIPEK